MCSFAQIMWIGFDSREQLVQYMIFIENNGAE